jgi:hypothetical protein
MPLHEHLAACVAAFPPSPSSDGNCASELEAWCLGARTQLEAVAAALRTAREGDARYEPAGPPPVGLKDVAYAAAVGELVVAACVLPQLDAPAPPSDADSAATDDCRLALDSLAVERLPGATLTAASVLSVAAAAGRGTDARDQLVEAGVAATLAVVCCAGLDRRLSAKLLPAVVAGRAQVQRRSGAGGGAVQPLTAWALSHGLSLRQLAGALLQILSGGFLHGCSLVASSADGPAVAGERTAAAAPTHRARRCPVTGPPQWLSVAAGR